MGHPVCNIVQEQQISINQLITDRRADRDRVSKLETELVQMQGKISLIETKKDTHDAKNTGANLVNKNNSSSGDKPRSPQVETRSLTMILKCMLKIN